MLCINNSTTKVETITGIKFDAVTEWIEFCKLKFPDCYTLSDIIKNHPCEFFQNVFFNFISNLLT